MKTERNTSEGVAVQTGFIHGGSFVRIADDVLRLRTRRSSK